MGESPQLLQQLDGEWEIKQVVSPFKISGTFVLFVFWLFSLSHWYFKWPFEIVVYWEKCVCSIDTGSVKDEVKGATVILNFY